MFLPLKLYECLGKFFDGELYIDHKKSSYNSLGFERFGFLGLFPAALSSLARTYQARAKKLGLGGNIKGDGYQNGGAIIVEAGGNKTLLHYKQKEAPDHVSNEEVLKVKMHLFYNISRFKLGLNQALEIPYDPKNIPNAETGPRK